MTALGRMLTYLWQWGWYVSDVVLLGSQQCSNIPPHHHVVHWKYAELHFLQTWITVCVFSTLPGMHFYVCCWKQLEWFLKLTINVSVISGADGGLCLCSSTCPGISNRQNSYSPAREDRWSPSHAAHMTYEGYYNGTYWEEIRGKLSPLKGHLMCHKIIMSKKKSLLIPLLNWEFSVECKSYQ